MKTLGDLPEAMAKSPELADQLSSTGSLEASFQLAREAGYDISASDIEQFMEKQDVELSNDDLAAVSGGGVFDFFKAISNFFRTGGLIAAGGQNLIAAGGQNLIAAGGQNLKNPKKVIGPHTSGVIGPNTTNLRR